MVQDTFTGKTPKIEVSMIGNIHIRILIGHDFVIKREPVSQQPVDNFQMHFTGKALVPVRGNQFKLQCIRFLRHRKQPILIAVEAAVQAVGTVIDIELINPIIQGKAAAGNPVAHPADHCPHAGVQLLIGFHIGMPKQHIPPAVQDFQRNQGGPVIGNRESDLIISDCVQTGAAAVCCHAKVFSHYFTIFSKAFLAAFCSACFLEEPVPVPSTRSSTRTFITKVGALAGPVSLTSW